MEEIKCAVEEVGETGAGIYAVSTGITSADDEQENGSFFRSLQGGRVEGVYVRNHPNIGVVKAYHNFYLGERDRSEVIAFIHNDVEIFEEGWGKIVLAMFEQDDRLAIVGLGGAIGMGHPDIYKMPYEITQLARVGYASNQRTWEVHGAREIGVRDVAVVDGFFMAVRVTFLDEVGGWKWIDSNFHCYDTAMCLMALRRGWKVKTIGLDCEHYGGGTSTKAEYSAWCRENGTSPEEEHRRPHKWQYAEFRDVLPVRVG